VIKYPAGIKPKTSKPITKKVSSLSIDSYKNRGMSLEHEINLTLDYYRDKQLALMQKRTTPINVVSVDYSKGAVITKAYFEKQSSTDYNGVYRGRYVDFEAKSTISKTSFPLANISSHQLQHLDQVLQQKGIGFFIFELQALDRIYLVEASKIIHFMRIEKRQSIPFIWLESHGHLIPLAVAPRLHFLPILDQLFF
jgi:recombination protein U